MGPCGCHSPGPCVPAPTSQRSPWAAWDVVSYGGADDLGITLSGRPRIHQATLDGDEEVTSLGTVLPGREVVLEFTQDATGGRDLTFNVAGVTVRTLGGTWNPEPNAKNVVHLSAVSSTLVHARYYTEGESTRVALGASTVIPCSRDKTFTKTISAASTTFTAARFVQDKTIILELTISGGSVTTINLPSEFKILQPPDGSADLPSAYNDGDVVIVSAFVADATDSAEIVDCSVALRGA